MKLTFKDKNGNKEVLGVSHDVEQLLDIVREHWKGELPLAKQTEIVGKSYGKDAPEGPPWIIDCEDGSSFHIS